MSLDLDALVDEARERIGAAASLDELEAARVALLGRKGALTAALKSLGSLPVAERPAAGQAVNRAKGEVQSLLETRRATLADERLAERLAADSLDVTLPGAPPPEGGLHPITLTIERIGALFAQIGFDVAVGPEVEDDHHNFEALNFPPEHPARAMHDTFWFDSERLLRTHTSSVQIRYMREHEPPMRIVAPGRVYRCDSDMTHSPMFHQVEGLLVDRDVGLSDLMGHLEGFLRAFFDQDDCRIRFRPSYFPFTEPSAELYVKMDVGRGLEWVEIGGCGMVDPAVFEQVGYAPEQWRGFAFGLGIERLAMRRYGIPDIRWLFENDLRFLRAV